MHCCQPPTILLAAIWFLFATAVSEADAPDGYWLSEEGKGIVELRSTTNGGLTGRIAWLKDATYGPTEDASRSGGPRLDDRNPDASKRDRPLLGLQILWGFKPAPESGVYEGGRIYDPENGMTYTGTITMVSKNRLELRGYVLISMIGRSSFWTWVDGAKFRNP